MERTGPSYGRPAAAMRQGGHVAGQGGVTKLFSRPCDGAERSEERA
jgi:hypothetical protein